MFDKIKKTLPRNTEERKMAAKSVVTIAVMSALFAGHLIRQVSPELAQAALTIELAATLTWVWLE